MSVNCINFLISNSRHIKFTTVEMIGNAKSLTLLTRILNIARLYFSRGFKIKEIHMDGKFESIQSDLLKNHINLNICSKSEHVGKIERQNRTVKERVRGIYNMLPFKKMPGQLITEMVYTAVFWLNTFYFARHTLSDLSPRTISTGLTVDFNKHCKQKFSTYVQTHEDTNNTMRMRTVKALALSPTSNEQGGIFTCL